MEIQLPVAQVASVDRFQAGPLASEPGSLTCNKPNVETPRFAADGFICKATQHMDRKIDLKLTF